MLIVAVDAVRASVLRSGRERYATLAPAPTLPAAVGPTHNTLLYAASAIAPIHATPDANAACHPAIDPVAAVAAVAAVATVAAAAAVAAAATITEPTRAVAASPAHHANPWRTASHRATLAVSTDRHVRCVVHDVQKQRQRSQLPLQQCSWRLPLWLGLRLQLC